MFLELQSHNAGTTAEVPLYGVAAAQRCLEEFDALLEHAGTFGSESWQGARRLFDVHRIANMLLAQDDIGLRLTGIMTPLVYHIHRLHTHSPGKFANTSTCKANSPIFAIYHVI
jgi:hypothetical protein